MTGFRSRTLPALIMFVLVLALVSVQRRATAPAGAHAASSGATRPLALTPSLERWQALVQTVGDETGVPWSVLDALLAVTSGGNPIARGPDGGIGLAQVEPQRWADMRMPPGSNLWDPATNLRVAAHILARQYERVGSWDAAAGIYLGSLDLDGQPVDLPSARDRLPLARAYVVAFEQLGNDSTLDIVQNGEVAPLASAALVYALTAQGTPYVWGGASYADGGFDCSGLMVWAYGLAGVTLPRTAAEQWAATPHITADQLRPGDLVFFADTNGPGITHVGMYAGDGVMLNAPNERDTVRLMALDDPYWQQHLVGFGRPVE
jgi:cell wall-associated NlpC family hydrolase